jgi:LysM repeat protein
MSFIRRRPTRTAGSSRPGGGTDAHAPLMMAHVQTTGEVPTAQSATVDGQPDGGPIDEPAASTAVPEIDIPQQPDDCPGFTRGTTTAAVPVSHGGRTYRVRTDDDVLSIAARHGVSAPALIELNDLHGPVYVRPGQILSLPEKNDAPADPAGYRVRPGDTLASIAAAHRISREVLRRANALGEADLLVTGEVLSLTGTGASSSRIAPRVPEHLPSVPESVGGRPYPARVLRAARINKSLLLAEPQPDKQWVRETIARLAPDFEVPADLAIAVASQESGLRHHTVAPVNALGIMQVTPAAGDWAGSLCGRQLNILDPLDNITAGLAILHHVLAGAPDEKLALAAYYQGAASVAEHGMADDTRAFVRGVQIARDRLKRQNTWLHAVPSGPVMTAPILSTPADGESL